MSGFPRNFVRPRRQDRIELAPAAAALVILPIAIVVVGTYFNARFLWQEVVNPAALPVLEPCLSHRHEAIGRTRLLASFLPYLLVSLLIFFYFAREFFWFFGPQVRRRLILPIMLFLAPATYIFVTQASLDDPFKAMGAGLYGAVFERLASCGAGRDTILFAPGAGIDPLTVLHSLAIAFSFLLVLAAGSVIIGTLSTLASPRTSLPASVRAYYRRVQRDRLDRYLYASALLLVFGLFVMDSALRWPAPFTEDPALYLQHVNELMLYNGIFYSTILAAYYVPVALWQRGQYARRRPGGRNGAETLNGPDEPGMAARLSPSHLMKTILALLSPAIAGVLTQLLEGLGGA